MDRTPEPFLRHPNIKQCFFGEHQLAAVPDCPVAIVESEKTAILMTALRPDLIWLATGGTNGCQWMSTAVFEVLRDRKVVLYPDLGCYEDWSDKAIILQRAGFQVAVSDLLEQQATAAEVAAGYDLADYCIKRDEQCGWAMAEGGYPLFWDG